MKNKFICIGLRTATPDDIYELITLHKRKGYTVEYIKENLPFNGILMCKRYTS